MGEFMARNSQVYLGFAEPYWNGTFGTKGSTSAWSQKTYTRIELDERTMWYCEAVASSKGMTNPTVGAGQVYMTTKRGSKGNLFQGDKTYKLHVSKDVPGGQFWSLTLNTRRPYENAESRSVSLDRKMRGLKYNSDGSTDLSVRANAPVGYERNIIKSVGNARHRPDG